MNFGIFLGILIAIGIHAGIILFGGALFKSHAKDQGTLQKVELLSEEEAEEEKEKEEQEEEEREEEELEAEAEQAPDGAEINRNMEVASSNDAPELEAASLGAIEAALSGQGSSGGDFGDSLSFASGGRIGGTGKAGSQQNLDEAFNLSEIDQKPRAIFQVPPKFPSNMRSTEGVVAVIFIVDPAGRVTNLKVEKSSHKEFEKPAMDAVKQWKFEAALRGGERVSCRMRVPIRFQPK